MLVFNDLLAFKFHVQELPLAHVDLIMQFPSPVVLVFFFSDSLFEQLFFLVHQHSLQPHCALLKLNLATLQFFEVVVLEKLVDFLSLLNLFELPLLPYPLFFQFLLVPVSSSKQFFSLLISNVS